MGLGYSRESQSSFWEQGVQPQSCWGQAVLSPWGLVPLPAAAGEAHPQLELLLLQPSPAASPGPAPRALHCCPCCFPPTCPRAGGSPSFSWAGGNVEASLGGQRAVGLCCELSSQPCASVSPSLRGDR